MMPPMRGSPGFDLLRDRFGHGNLVLGPLVAVAMAGIDHDAGRKSRRGHEIPRRIDACSIVIRDAAAAQDHVAVRVSASRGDRRPTLLGHRQEMMSMRGGLYPSTAIFTFPSVPFLNPTGQESPEASSR
jgi:hypothetical protein